MTNQNHKSEIRNPNKVESLYIHIPFCKRKCNYCDFVSYSGKEELIGEYVEALTKEIDYWAQDRRTARLKTIYFGGGTPTLLKVEHFNKIINTLICHLSLDICHSETSVEANPGTADLEKLKALRKLGINRISIGAQSFNDKHLQTLGRIHNSKDITKFYEDARAAGFTNINLDLIFALPDQTLEEWKKDIQKALALEPEHLSTYNLQIEEETPFGKITNDKLKMSNECSNHLNLPSEDIEADIYEYAIEALKKAGYIHYEISNFAKLGFECQHNIAYWKNQNYIGIGAGAHSHVNGKRWANTNSIEKYVACGYAARNGICPTLNDSSRATDQRETIFMGLRLLDGIEAKKFTGFEREVEELIKDGLLMRENDHYKLTHKGLYLGNSVFEKFV